LNSYLDEDQQPDHWSLDSDITMNNSPYSLKLYGNTWKSESIAAVQLADNDVWEVSCYVADLGEIQAFGISDGENAIIYSLYGSQELDLEEWFPVYQGSKPEESWQQFSLPVADDWFSWYEYYPAITELIFINDNDNGSGTVYFDNVCRITEDLPQPPNAIVYYELGDFYSKSSSNRSIDVQFYSWADDPDSEELSFLWSFGDDTSSSEEDPLHTYTIEDDHLYTVLLEVEDETGLKGYASCEIQLEEGESSFPVTMNFVGDIMLARGFEQTGGIIQTLGVEAIFEPTLDILGNAADITVANLESPLTTHNEHHPTKTIYFKGDPENAAGLVYAGIDIVTLANNHIVDYNYPGLLETQETMDEYGIRHSGAGANSVEAYQPLYYNKKGVNFAFLASSDRTGQYNNYQPFLYAGFNKPGFAYMTPYYISEQINAVEEYADFKIVEMHAGSEYSTSPGSNYDLFEPGDLYPDEDYHADIDIPHMWDIAIRHHAVDAGADLVIVHHPHIIQGLELYNGKLIAHSLGNYAFDLNYAETMPTIILNTKLNETGFFEFIVKPVYIDDWIPQEAKNELGLYILDHLAMLSRDMNTYLKIDRRDVEASVIMDTLNMELIYTERQEVLPVELDGDFVISEPVRLERSGSISSVLSIDPYIDWEIRLGREKLWFGNFEDEGCTSWNINSDNEWLDDTESHGGSYSLRQRRFPDSGDNVVTNLENRIKLYEADSYTIQGYIKTINAEDATIQIRYYNTRTGGTMIEQEDVGILVDGDSDWTYFSNELDVPDNCNYFDIRASSDCPDEGEAFAWFDDIGLIAWEEWHPLEPGEEIVNPNDYYYLQLRAESFCTEAFITYQETAYEQGPVVGSDDNNIPSNSFVVLKQNYPNPFIGGNNSRSGGTRIDFTILKDKKVSLEIYNIRGQLVRILLNDVVEKGDYSIHWNGTDKYNRNVSSGLYFYKIKA
ncbi:CapA family protein, partial [Candidatus Cloacimonadota bacterium]